MDSYGNLTLSGYHISIQDIERIVQSVADYPNYLPVMVYNPVTGEYYGTIQMETIFIQISRVEDHSQEVIICDDLKKEMYVIEYSTVSGKIVSFISPQSCEEAILDSFDGSRWEGSLKDGEIYGFGEAYNNSNGLEYQGYQYRGNRVCHGIEYYADLDIEKYNGCYLNGKKWGWGRSLDRNSDVDYKGIWIDDSAQTLSKYCAVHSPWIDWLEDHLQISACPNDNILYSIFYLHLLPRLQTLSVGPMSCNGVRQCNIEYLPRLERIDIQDGCFSVGPYIGANDSICRIAQCPSLLQLTIGNNSFHDYLRFELEEVNALQDVCIGRSCFQYAEFFSLQSKFGSPKYQKS